jgi:hypothetical protein
MKKLLLIPFIFASCSAPIEPTLCECFEASRKGYDSDAMRKKCEHMAKKISSAEMNKAIRGCIGEEMKKKEKKEKSENPTK